jgi:hypothetical protein
MTGTTKKKEPKYDGQIDVITKTGKSIGDVPNRKGFNVSDCQTFIDAQDLPFTKFDNVDKFLNDIIKFTSDYKGIKKPKDYYIYHPEKMSFIPVKVGGNNQSGGRRRRKHKRTKKVGRRRRGTRRLKE